MGLVDIVSEDNSEIRKQKKEFQEALHHRRVVNMWHVIANAVFSMLFLFVTLPTIPWIICTVIFWTSVTWTSYRIWKLWPTRKVNQ